MAWLFSILILCVAFASIIGGSNKPGKSKIGRDSQSSSTGYNNNNSNNIFWSYDSNPSADNGSSDNSYSSDSCSSSSSDYGSNGGDSGSCDAGF